MPAPTELRVKRRHLSGCSFWDRFSRLLCSQEPVLPSAPGSPRRKEGKLQESVRGAPLSLIASWTFSARLHASSLQFILLSLTASSFFQRGDPSVTRANESWQNLLPSTCLEVDWGRQGASGYGRALPRQQKACPEWPLRPPAPRCGNSSQSGGGQDQTVCLPPWPLASLGSLSGRCKGAPSRAGRPQPWLGTAKTLNISPPCPLLAFQDAATMLAPETGPVR